MKYSHLIKISHFVLIHLILLKVILRKILTSSVNRIYSSPSIYILYILLSENRKDF